MTNSSTAEAPLGLSTTGSAVEMAGVFGRVAAVDVDACPVQALASFCAEVTRLEGWLGGLKARAAHRAKAHGPLVEMDVADATHTDLRTVESLAERGRLLADAPDVAQALTAGALTIGHVDALSAAGRRAEPDTLPRLLAEAPALIDAAQGLSPRQFQQHVNGRVNTLEHQQQAARARRERDGLRWWSAVRDDGMYHFGGVLDPLSGIKLDNRVNALVNQLRDQLGPGEGPGNPIERKKWQRGIAFQRLLGGGGVGVGEVPAGRPELILVVDTRDLDPEGRPAVRWQLPVSLGDDVTAEIARQARVHPVVLTGNTPHDPDGVIHHDPGAHRLATPVQRRALRAVHATCAITGCDVAFDRCQVHHLTDYVKNGLTVWSNLAPLCSHHHHRLHQEGWLARLDGQHQLTLHPPPGQGERGQRGERGDRGDRGSPPGHRSAGTSCEHAEHGRRDHDPP